MRLGELETRRLLPSWMRSDDADLALAQGVDAAVNGTAPQLALLTLWDALDMLPDAVLDELADALDVQWYDAGAPRAVRVALVRESDLVHAKLGTVDAVEQVVASYFGAGRVMEWFDYDGEPHHFKVFTTDPSAVGDNLERFLGMLEKVKRKSSVLDAIMIGLTGEETARVGTATRVTSRETVVFGKGAS